MSKCTIDIEGGPEIILHDADAQEIIFLLEHITGVAADSSDWQSGSIIDVTSKDHHDIDYLISYYEGHKLNR